MNEPASEELSPTARTVYEALAPNAPMTQTDLIEATGLSFLTVREALDRLQERGEVEELIYSHGRLRLYLLDTDGADRSGSTRTTVA